MSIYNLYNNTKFEKYALKIMHKSVYCKISLLFTLRKKIVSLCFSHKKKTHRSTAPDFSRSISGNYIFVVM